MQPTEKDFPFYTEFQFAFLSTYSKNVHLFVTKCTHFRKKIFFKAPVLQILLQSHGVAMSYHVCHVIYPSLPFIKYRCFSFISKLTLTFSFTLLIVHYNSHPVVWIWPSNWVSKEKQFLYSLMNMIYFKADGWD